MMISFAKVALCTFNLLDSPACSYEFDVVYM